MRVPVVFAILVLFSSIVVPANLAAADAFRLTGVVSDGPGRPVAFARVTALSTAGRAIGRPTVCGTEGAYSLRVREEVKVLVVVDQRGARCLQRTGPWRAEARVDADFARARLFTLRGKIVDPGKTLMRGLMDPGAKWDGKFDLVARRLVRISAFADGLMLLTVNPDSRGGFRIASGLPITHLVVESSGGFSVRKSGPWSRDATVEINTSQERTFTLRGKVMNAKGVAQRYARVVARGARGETLVEGYTGVNAAFSLRSDREVASLEASVGGIKIEQSGPWKSDATIDLRPAGKQGFPIRGRVVDASGRGVRGVRMVAVDENGRSVDHALSDDRGAYRLIANRPVTGVLAYRSSHRQEEKKTGRWTSAASVDFTFGATGKVAISGSVRTKAGAAAAGVPVTAYDFSGKPIEKAVTDRRGVYRLEVSQPVSRVQAIARGRRSTVSGPWDADAKVDITLRH